MKSIELTFHGACETVTGSCTQVDVGRRRLLIDCGLFQGSRSLETLNNQSFAFDPRAIDAVILTHAHIDHSGLLPRLAAEGFAGPIYCTGSSKALLTYLLADAAHIQEWDAERRNHRRDRAGEPPIEPLYTSADAERALALMRPIERDRWFEPVEGLQARMWNAGHILGSCSVELRADDQSVLFSGDIGAKQMSFLPPSDAPAGVDHVICESTYGDRERADISLDQRRDLLEAEIADAFAHNGNLVIPVFAVERTQELLLDMADLIIGGRLKNRMVFVDSPLANKITRVFASHRDELEDMDRGPVFDQSAFHYVESVSESIRLHSLSGAIIMAGSGMCEGGRIRHHLLHNLSRSDSTVLFVGYQAEGTLGRAILDGAQRVRISGQDVVVRARIRRIDSYSAHADRAELIEWIGKRQPIRGSLFLNHGERAAITSLRGAVERKCNSVVIPVIGERYRLSAGLPAKRLKTGRPDARDLIGQDWQNEYARLAVMLKKRLQAIDDVGARREAIQRMSEVLDAYKGRRPRRRRGG